MQAIVDCPPRAPSLALGGPADPHLNVLVVSFDGTGNDRDHVLPGEVETLTGRLDRHFSALQTHNFQSRYYAGVTTPDSMRRRGHEVGTPVGVWTGLTEGVFGRGTKLRAQEAMKEFNEFVKGRRAADPNARFHVHINAFSRGCASALILANMLHDADVKDAKLTGRRADGSHVRTSGVMLDAVTTGVDFSEWLKPTDLQLPPTAVAYLHLVAGGEERGTFNLTSLVDPLRESEIACFRNVYMSGADEVTDDDGRFLHPRLLTVTAPMLSHTDMAGGFPGSSSYKVVEFAALSYMQSLGLPVRPAAPTQAEMSMLTAAHWSGRQMGDDLVFSAANGVSNALDRFQRSGPPLLRPFVWLLKQPVQGTFRYMNWIDGFFRQPTELAPKEVERKEGLKRRVGQSPRQPLPDPSQLLVSQEARLVRTHSMEPPVPVQGLPLTKFVPDIEPEGLERNMSVQDVRRFELIQFSADEEGDVLVLTKGYVFDREGVLRRPNGSRVEMAQSRSQIQQLLRENGPMTLEIAQEKSIAVVNGHQLPNAKAEFEAVVAKSTLLAPAGRQVPTPTMLGGLLLEPKLETTLGLSARGKGAAARGDDGRAPRPPRPS